MSKYVVGLGGQNRPYISESRERVRRNRPYISESRERVRRNRPYISQIVAKSSNYL
jgi:hypothetical protein